MNHPPLVSVVLPFLDAERFLDEAVQSVLNQTHGNWELLLVDDGSTDSGTEIARGYAATHRGVHCLHHEEHENRGISASRNLGIRHATGEFVALLDADDVYTPEKLERQVAILRSQPAAAMVYGKSLYWHGWTGDAADVERDRVQEHGIGADVLLHPPGSVAAMINGEAAVPCPCSVLARRQAIDKVGGFEDSFRGMYEDQAFYTKMFLSYPVFVSNECLDRYRQHEASVCSVTARMGQLLEARRRFLGWMGDELVKRGEDSAELWQALRQETWLARDRPGIPFRVHARLRRMEKWLLRIEASFVAAGLHRRLWNRRVPSLAAYPESGVPSRRK